MFVDPSIMIFACPHGFYVKGIATPDVTQTYPTLHLQRLYVDPSCLYSSSADRCNDEIELIKEKLSHFPRRMDGYIFNLSHNAITRSMNYSKKNVGMYAKKDVTTYALRHSHCS